MSPMVGDIKLSARDLEAESGGEWLACDGREITRAEYPKLCKKLGYNYGPVKGVTLGVADLSAAAECDYVFGCYRIDSLRFGVLMRRKNTINSYNLFLLTFSNDFKSSTMTPLGETGISMDKNESIRFFLLRGGIAALVGFGKHKDNSYGYTDVATWNVTADPGKLNLMKGSTRADGSGSGGRVYHPVFDPQTRTLYATGVVGTGGVFLTTFQVDTGAISCVYTGLSNEYGVSPTSAGIYGGLTNGYISKLYQYDGTTVSIYDSRIQSPYSVMEYQGRLYFIASDRVGYPQEPTTRKVANLNDPTTFITDVGHFPMPYSWNVELPNIYTRHTGGGENGYVIFCEDGAPFIGNFISIESVGGGGMQSHICVAEDGKFTVIGRTDETLVHGSACSWRNYTEDGRVHLAITDFTKTAVLPKHIANNYLISTDKSGGGYFMRPVHPTAYIKAR